MWWALCLCTCCTGHERITLIVTCQSLILHKYFFPLNAKGLVDFESMLRFMKRHIILWMIVCSSTNIEGMFKLFPTWNIPEIYMHFFEFLILSNTLHRELAILHKWHLKVKKYLCKRRLWHITTKWNKYWTCCLVKWDNNPQVLVIELSLELQELLLKQVN